MITDELKNIGRYRGMSRWLDTAVTFLEQTDLQKLPLGRTIIDGDYVFANVMEAQAKEDSEVKYEIHRKYMDIQIDLEGTERLLTGGTVSEQRSFDEMTDFGTVDCVQAAETVLGAGRFIICMKEEPHKPSLAAGADRRLRKCVIKVWAEK